MKGVENTWKMLNREMTWCILFWKGYNVAVLVNHLWEQAKVYCSSSGEGGSNLDSWVNGSSVEVVQSALIVDNICR